MEEVKPEEKLEEQEGIKQEEKTAKEKKNGGKKVLIAILILLAVAIIGIGGYLLLNREEPKKETSKVDSEVKKSEYRISGNSLEKFDLYFLQLENEAVNKVYSPLSIKYALAMLNEGTKGESNAQIAAVIGDYAAKKYVNSKNMSFANAMFIRDSFKESVNSDYTNNLSTKYNAEIIYDSFETPNNLNYWVSNKTFSLINNLFDDVKDKDFILVNALAIDMEWNKLIQADSSVNKEKSVSYNIDYLHEDFSDFIGDIGAYGGYTELKFNNDTMNAKTVKIGAAINRYDIVTELGEENIRKTVRSEFEKYLQENTWDKLSSYFYGEDITGLSDDELMEKYLDRYIKEINSNYKRVDSSTDFLLYDDEEVKAFAKDLEEAEGTTLQYIGIMPKKVSLDSYIKDINTEKVNGVINGLKEIKLENFKDGVVTRIIGNIPLFKFEYELKLMEDLKKLGITDVFEKTKADLSGMVKGEAVIIDASHKANIEFSNQGIKATAATAIGGAGSAAGGFDYKYEVPVEVIDLTFNNPYMFLIRDKKSGEVWFAGTVYEPIEFTEATCDNNGICRQ